MGNFIQIVNTCLPVIAMLLIGMLCRKKQIISREGIENMKKFVMEISLPVVLFDAFATADYSLKYIPFFIFMFLITWAMYYFGILLGKISGEKSKYLAFTTITFEVGMIGYPLYILLYPNEPLGRLASTDLGHNIFIFTIYKMMLSRIEGGEKISGKAMLKEMFRSTTLKFVILGVIFGATGLYRALEPSGITSMIGSLTSFIGAPTSAVILLCVGYNLEFANGSRAALFRTGICRVVSLIICRVIIGAAVRLIGLENMDHALNLLCILPPSYALSVFVNKEEGQSYVSGAISIDTVLTIIAFFILAVTGI